MATVSPSTQRPPSPRSPRESRHVAIAPEPSLVPRHVWGRIVVLGVLFVALFGEIIVRLGLFAWHDGDWSHAFLVPLFSLFFIHQQKDEVRRATPRTSWPGLGVMLAGIAVYVAALRAGNDMAKGYAMVATLFGLAVLMCGPGVMRVLWFPILYLLFAVKVSHELWEAIAWNLQLAAANGATFTLQFFGLDAVVSTTQIQLFKDNVPLQPLNVAEACSGMRMLMTFAALGVAMAYLWDRPWWARLAMVLATVPIAVAVNIGRVTVLGVVSIDHPEYSRGDFHILLGMFMLIPAMGLFLLVGWMLTFLSDAADAPPRAAEPPAQPRDIQPTPAPTPEPRVASAAFIAASLVLLISVAGLWGGVYAADMHLFKRALPLREPVYLLPENFGGFHRTQQRQLSEEMLHELGTHRYVLWDMQDTDASAAVRDVTFHLAYHSGEADARPDVRRRSIVTQGLEPQTVEELDIELLSPPVLREVDGGATAINAQGQSVRLPGARLKLGAFEQASSRDRATTVIYGFIANGQMLTEPSAVRDAVFDLRLRGSYWCKVELVVPTTDRDLVRQTARRFFSHALPAIMTCLPEAPPPQAPAARDPAR